jgi:hypothetical protein
MKQHKCRLILVQEREGYFFAWCWLSCMHYTLCTHSLSVVHPPNVWGSCVNNVLFMDHSSVVALYFGGSLTPSTTLVDFSSRSESMGHATLENFSFLVTTSWPYQYFYFYFCIFSILWCSWSGDHPWDDLAGFGNSNIWK